MGWVRGHLASKDTIYLYMSIHQSLWIQCHLPHLLSHTAFLLLLLTPALCHPFGVLRSLTQSLSSTPSLVLPSKDALITGGHR